MTSLASFLFVAASVLGQADQPSPNYEHLKGLEFIIGDWDVKGVVWDDVPGVIAKGTKLVGHGQYRWIWNQGAIHWRWTIEYETGGKVFGNGTATWNPGTKQIVSVSMLSTGGYGQGVWKSNEDGKEWILIDKQTDSEGKETLSCVHHVQKDNDTILWQITDQKVDDKELPDTPKFEFVRVKQK
jgi:hypothetical protein